MYSSVFCLQPVYELVNTELTKSILQGLDSLLHKEGEQEESGLHANQLSILPVEQNPSRQVE